jgi:hypothetical protein
MFQLRQASMTDCISNYATKRQSTINSIVCTVLHSLVVKLIKGSSSPGLTPLRPAIPIFLPCFPQGLLVT